MNVSGKTEAPSNQPTVVTSRQEVYAEQLAAIPEFAKLGPLFKSSAKPLELTESETEYVVNCVKHVFNDHIVFQVIHTYRFSGVRSLNNLEGDVHGYIL